MTRLASKFQFWSEAAALKGAATPSVLVRAGVCGVFALLVTAIHFDEHLPSLNVALTSFEVGGAVLGVLLVLRTNAGYERWWEGRKLWGGIVNQSRNLAVSALSYGPDDPAWRERFVRWTVAFSQASRLRLRGRRAARVLISLLGPEDAALLLDASHPPSYVLEALARMLNEARSKGLDPYAFLEMDRQRGLLMDHIGGCERILKSPLPRAYGIQVRRFILLFLATLPFGLVERVRWLTPLVALLVAYPILALDDIGNELQYPFSSRSLNHLPLEDICATIEHDLLAMLAVGPTPQREARDPLE